MNRSTCAFSLGEREAVLRTPGLQQDLQFGLTEVGVGGAQPPDLVAQGRGPRRLPATARGAGASGQGLRIALGLEEVPFPAIERAPAHPTGLTGRRGAVTSTKLQKNDRRGYGEEPLLRSRSRPRVPERTETAPQNFHSACNCRPWLTGWSPAGAWRWPSRVRVRPEPAVQRVPRR